VAGACRGSCCVVSAGCASAGLAGAFVAGAFFAGTFFAGTFFAGTFVAGAFFAGAFFAGTFFAGTFFAGTFFAGTFFFTGAGRLLTAAAFLTVICFFLATGDLPAARGFAALAIVSASRGRKGSRTLHRSGPDQC